MPERDRCGLYKSEDFSEVLKESDTLGILVGGMAVNVWANYYLDRRPEIHEYKPFVSHDIDFYGTRKNASEFNQKIGWNIQTFKRRKAGGPVNAILTSEEGLVVDVMNSVNGLTSKDIKKLTTSINFAGSPLPIISPPGLLKAKLANLFTLNQEEGQRQDLNQAKMLVPINQEFLKDSIQAVHDAELPARQTVLYLNTMHDTIHHRHAKPYRELFGERGELIFPVSEIKNSTSTPIRNFYNHRLS